MTAALPVGAGRPLDQNDAAAWRRHLMLLAGIAMLLLAVFLNDARGLALIWWTNTTFGHCLFIGPVIVWLVWQRRRDLGQLAPSAWAPGLFLVGLGGGAWLTGNVASVALARHLGIVLMLQGAVLTMLGPQVARALLFPLCYAFFLVPFGESLEGPLQAVTVSMTMALLHLLGVPAQVDGVLITIPNGYFEVAEACSGAKFVIAMMAYGTLVANVCYVSWGRRAAFMVMALIVPVVANGLRAAGTIYAAHLTSVEQATGFDHIMFGWIFFGLVMAAVLAIGWKWFDRDPDAPWFDAESLPVPRSRIDPLVAAALVLAVAAIFPSWAGAIAGRTQLLPEQISLPSVPGWSRVAADPGAAWSPNYPGADHFLLGRYADGQGASVDLAIAVYGTQHEGKELVGFGIGPLRENDRWVRVATIANVAGGRTMRITAPGPVERLVAVWYRIGGVTTTSERTVKIETLKTKLLGGSQAAVAVLVSTPVARGRDPSNVITRFVTAMGGVDTVADLSAGNLR
ncbi:MAG: exosortase A [Sphingomonas sp.]